MVHVHNQENSPSGSVREENVATRSPSVFTQLSCSSYSTTGVSPAEALFNRKIKIKLPDVSKTSTTKLDNKIRLRDQVNKNKMKDYADLKCRASEPDIQVGDAVLVRQRPENKLSPHYSPIPMQVTSRKGSAGHC